MLESLHNGIIGDFDFSDPFGNGSGTFPFGEIEALGISSFGELLILTCLCSYNSSYLGGPLGRVVKTAYL